MMDKNKIILSESVSIIESECNKLKKETNINKIVQKCFELSAIENKSFYDKVKLKKTINEILASLRSTVDFDSIYSDLPFFTPDEMLSFGVFDGENNRYSESPDNDIIFDNITSKDWFNIYQYNYRGINTENDKKYTIARINKLKELFLDYDEIKESGELDKLRSRQQSILELGWHPDIPFTEENRVKAKERILSILKEKYTKEFIDLSSFIEANEDEFNPMQETTIRKLYPVFIVLVSGTNAFSAAIKKYTNIPYSHAAIGLDSDLKHLYSFNISYGGGFTYESIDLYNKEQNIAVFTIFVDKNTRDNIEDNINKFKQAKDKTKYSFLNILAFPFQVQVDIDMKMICSQFVDSILKLSEINLVDKASSLVAPGDFYKSYMYNDKIYKIYEGKNKEYNKARIDKYLAAISYDVKYIKEFSNILTESSYLQTISENMNSISSLICLEEKAGVLDEFNLMVYENLLKPYISIPLSEVKEFPVQFSNDGDLLISKAFNINFEEEYSTAHKLLLLYETNNNIEGMKYELSKLWYLNLLLERKLYKKTTKDKDEFIKVRARILNDFNKYLKMVNKEDKNFNFTEYYNATPFSDATVKIKGSTLKYTLKYLKDAILL
jgi:hypothetical protein